MTSNIPRAMAALLLVTTIVSCAGAGARPATSPANDDAARAAIEAAMQRYTALLKSGPPSAVAAMFTTKGQLLEPGMAVLTGPEAIAKFLSPLYADVTIESASTKTESIEMHGDSAEQWGTYIQRVAEIGKPAQNYQGRYVVDWQREAGEWRIARFMVQPAQMNR